MNNLNTKHLNKQRYYSIELSSFKLDGGAMFGIIPKPLWEKKYPCDQQNRIQLALRLLLIQTKNKNILIDTGIGTHHPEKFEEIFEIIHKNKENSFSKGFEELGLKNSDITDLVLSHLHFDHAGGLLNNDEITFKNATIHLHQKHFQYAQKPSLRDSGSFHAKNFLKAYDFYQKNNQIHFLNEEKGIILSDQDYQLNFLCSHGHTPFMIHPYDHHVFYLADLVPTSRHLPIPWVMGYDISPAVTTKEKSTIIDFIVNNKLKVIFEHDKDIIASLLKNEVNQKTNVHKIKLDNPQNVELDNKTKEVKKIREKITNEIIF